VELGLVNKVALISASSAGIGKAIAAGLACEGAHISMFSRRADVIAAAARDISQVAVGSVIHNVGDLRQKGDIDRVVKDTEDRLGPIDILVNNQGGPAAGTLEGLADQDLRAAIETNLEAVLYLTRHCLSSMKARRWGRIVNVLSVSGKEPLPGMLLSNILRPAVLGFAKSIASEYAPFGITVNSLLPSAVLTARAHGFIEARASREGSTLEEALAAAAGAIPAGHIASPEEFAAVAVFLCSPLASYVTGTAIPVDGGVTRSLY
jgi:3-oxoacyl-[acyl-carrier protein] reductase